MANRPRGSSAWLGLASVLIPTPVVALILLQEIYPRIGQGLNGYAGMLGASVIYLGAIGAVVVGGGCAVVSLVMERRKWLGVVGLVLSLAMGWFVFLRA